MDESKDKKSRKLELEQHGLMSGFVDGELDEVQRQKLCSCMSAEERASACEAVTTLRRGIRAYVKSHGQDESWSVWECIESQCVPYRKSIFRLIPNSLVPKLRIASISGVLDGTRDAMQTLIQPRVAGTVFAGSMCLMLVSFLNSPSGVDSNDESQTLVASTTSAGVDGVTKEPSVSATMVASAIDSPSRIRRAEQYSSARRVVSRSAESAFTSRDVSFVGAERASAGTNAMVSFVGTAPSARRVVQAQSYNPRGLKIGGADIDWIDAPTHVEIMQVGNKRRPPVIWVGEAVH